MLIAHLKNVFPDYATQPPPIADLQTFYREAKAAFDADDEFKKVAHAEVVRLQGGDGASRFAWKAICEVSRLEFEKVSGST
jgi:arginyl-tRNA synthetase